MQAALFVFGVFPPPAAAAWVGAGLNCAGAGGAADRRVSLVVQGVVGDFVLFDILPHLLGCPIGEWVDFYEGGGGCVQLYFCDAGSGDRLFGAQAGDPSF